MLTPWRKSPNECSSIVLVALIFLVQRNIFQHQYCSILCTPPKFTGYFYCTNDHQFQLFQCSRISCTGVHKSICYTDVHQCSSISCTDVHKIHQYTDVHQCSSISFTDVYQCSSISSTDVHRLVVGAQLRIHTGELDPPKCHSAHFSSFLLRKGFSTASTTSTTSTTSVISQFQLAKLARCTFFVFFLHEFLGKYTVQITISTSTRTYFSF